ncbi:23S rRNA (cytidine(2498)-2'-O)-methyltransferase RlmM [Ectothiorhodospiraceae bacterium WFHF3C12]|nr:23S rRNA (cytidine(2498)-2'-O)-methyltransferase RlmM [Ectothiorhodospiraceae bacterium WFHF3C12]
MRFTALLVQCRAGFENDCAAELTERAAAENVWGYCKAQPGAGFVEYFSEDGPGLARALTQLPMRTLVFARQWAGVVDIIEDLPQADRATPIAEIVAAQVTHVSGVFIEYPDTNTGKQLSAFSRKFQRPIEAALARAGVQLAPETDAPRLQLFFTDSSRVRVALADPGNSAGWPMGILRLKMPRQAPSRSTLKLDEALKRLFTEEERAQLLRPGGHAVDLGAAPGGWTWQLTERGMFVTAIDNGPMDATLMAGGRVEHLRSDAFTYRPARAVDLLVCDIVDKPARVAGLMADWLERGWCRAAVFNLKLPMRKRYAAVRDALALIAERVGEKTGRSPAIACKQLYHDREEVTALVRLA